MPRWRALPEELDPEVREFTGQLRRLVERSGLSVAALADRTGFSKTSWERYLNGRLLAPQRAVVALAEVTGAHTGHLTTLWELAERAWSRAEMRHDHTMEAIHVAQARAALGEAETPPARRPATGPDAPAAAPRTGELPSGADFSGTPASTAPPIPAPRDESAPTARRGRAAVLAAGAVGVLLIALGVVLLLNPGGGGGAKAAAKPSDTPSRKPVLPAGVRCSGAGCAGKDPEKMGCSGQHAVSPSRGTAGTVLVEVRYSEVCHAAWARITGAARGDQATVSAGDRSATARADGDGDAYTPMVAVPGDPAKVAACGTTVTGTKGCARPVPAAR